MNILITGSGAPGWYATRLLLKQTLSPQAKILGSDLSNNTTGAPLCDAHITLPQGNSPEYKRSILSAIPAHGITHIVPLTDPELAPLSECIIEAAELGCQILVSKKEPLYIASNKSKLYAALPELSPSTIILSSVEDIQKLNSGGKYYIKLDSSHGSRGTKLLVPEQEWISSFFDKKPAAFGSIFPINNLPSLLLKSQIIATEYLPGDEYSIDIVADHGEIKFYGVRQREVIKNGICDTALFIVDSHGEFLDFIRNILSKLKLSYNINIQAKRDSSGKLKLLEINPRVSGSIESFNVVGYNLLHMALDNSTISSITPSTYSRSRAYRVSHFI